MNINYITHLGTIFCIYATLGLSLNLILGYSGQMSLAHGAFLGIGAYTTAILSTRYHVNFFITILVGVLISAFLSYCLGCILRRFRGEYYLLITLGFNVIASAVFLNWQAVTKGPFGISGIEKPEPFFILVLLFLLIVYVLLSFVVASSFGRVIQAIRDDEKTIQVDTFPFLTEGFYGYYHHSFKLAVFMIGSCIASVAGSFLAAYLTYIDPSLFTKQESIAIMTIIILGGLASLRGSLIGAFILVVLPEILRFIGLPYEVAGQLRQLLLGLSLILLVLYRPKGIDGKFQL